MIVVCGIASEPPIARVTGALQDLGLPYTVLHQRRFQDIALDFEIDGTGVHGRLLDDRRAIDCATVTGVYTRLMDWRMLPETTGAPEETVRRCAWWHEVLGSWIEVAPGCVMNRSAATASNQSKPYQAQLISRAGFLVPETLVTDDPDLVRAFRDQHGQVVYKSISAVRSIVRLLDDATMERLPLIRSCPVQFQRRIQGVNVRVHAVAGELFATRIRADQVDYRYAAGFGGELEMAPWDLPDELAQRCLDLADGLGLALAGIDLMLTEEGETYCFEVNPSPAFTFFESHTGQPIARAIAGALGR
ncbi:RimK family alpha-L-glutamate ligase [Streptomyces sp. NPDC085481]|uniref:RimK family alpha-L-glutamate ligase n=1 Tax=Streptomyces sp. NPDC085481 TaxID=3365727 RepID=UPI0037D660C1